MKPDEAIALLDKALDQVQMNGATFKLLQEALGVLREAVGDRPEGEENAKAQRRKGAES